MKETQVHLYFIVKCESDNAATISFKKNWCRRYAKMLDGYVTITPFGLMIFGFLGNCRWSLQTLSKRHCFNRNVWRGQTGMATVAYLI